MTLLKSLARGGRTIVITIHQPSAMLFDQLDQLFVLAEGRCVYRGEPRQLLPFLTHASSLVCPPYHNPADYSKYTRP
jgi:ABC-type multidrug transport system ATPase subunit